MKAYSQFRKELPSKQIVLAFGDFQTPSAAHELLVKTTQKLANEQNASYTICVSNESTKLPVDRKLYYLNRMFPGTNITTSSSLVEAVTKLNTKYKNLVVVVGTDQLAESKKLLETHNGKKYNYSNITVVSSGERNPDSDTTMFKYAKKGDFDQFKESVPHQLTTVDARRLMNELREHAGIDPVKQQVKLATDWLRESYFRGQIYKIGEIVESNGQKFEIVDRGSNYLVVVDSNGDTHRKWITDVTPSSKEVVEEQVEENQISYKGYVTKNFNKETFLSFKEMIERESDPVAVLNAIKTTDIELALTEMKFTTSDKIKVARIIAGALGVVDVEKTSSPEQLVNNALRKVRNKPMRAEYVSVVKNMLHTAKEAGIEYDEKLVPMKIEEEASVEKEDSIANILKSWHDDPLSFNSEIADLKDVEHILPAYHDKELSIIDSDTGEHCCDVHEPDTKKTGKTIEQPASETDEYQASRYVKEELLNEVISRMERIRRKARFYRTKAKRQMRTQIALKKSSNVITLNKRAKRLALYMIKKRILRKEPQKASVQEKERIEKFLQKRHPLVDRLSRRLVPKVRQIERDRLHHKKYTDRSGVGSPTGK